MKLFRRSQILFSVLLFLSAKTFAVTYTGTGGPVPDNGPLTYFPLTISNLVPATLNSFYGLKRVGLKLTHTWDGDLDIYIQSPDGTIVLLSGGNGGDGDNYDSTFFTVDISAAIVEQNGAPFTGNYWAEGYLGAINNGQNGNGIWNLIVQDTYAQDVGDVLWFKLEFNLATSGAITFPSTNLPIVKINTGGNIIRDEPKIDASMQIIYNGAGVLNHLTDPCNNYCGDIQIEKRGSSSMWFAQVGYGFTTVDANDSALNAPILGMPAEHDWILYAPYDDKSLMRNALIYQLSNEMGHYAPHCMYVELLLNNQYEGIYVLMEKIKRDNHRVDIATLTPNDISGDALTGGYILKVDKWTGSSNDGWESNYRACDDTSAQSGHTTFQYDDPKGFQLLQVQKDYIQSYVDSFEDALHGAQFMDANVGYRNFIDVPSFIDFSLCNEISRNIDGYRLSSYLYKEKDSSGGKLHAGPIWDFNLTFGNGNYYNGAYWDDWEWNFPCPFGDGYQNPFWWQRFLSDTTYVSDLQCRYTYLRTNTFSNAHIHAVIDSLSNLLSAAQQRHYTRYAILGKYTWPNDWLPATWNEEVDTLSNWINARVAWMDLSLLKDSCAQPAIIFPLNNSVATADVFPNPAAAAQTISLRIYLPENSLLHLRLYDLAGRKIYSDEIKLTRGTHTHPVKTPANAGIYFLKVNDELKLPVMKVVVMR